MSLKQDINAVREELNSEEKFFEKAVMTEKFVKKYKNLMIGSVVAIVVIVAANIAYDLNKQSTIDAANTTLEELRADPQNEAALARLDTLSPSLHDVWVYSQAIADQDMKALEKLKSSKAELVADLSSYEVATASRDEKALNSYALRQESIYKDLAIVQSAVLMIQEGKVDKARAKLAQVSLDSSLAKVAKALMHYGVK